MTTKSQDCSCCWNFLFLSLKAVFIALGFVVFIGVEVFSEVCYDQLTFTRNDRGNYTTPDEIEIFRSYQTVSKTCFAAIGFFSIICVMGSCMLCVKRKINEPLPGEPEDPEKDKVFYKVDYSCGLVYLIVMNSILIPVIILNLGNVISGYSCRKGSIYGQGPGFWFSYKMDIDDIVWALFALLQVYLIALNLSYGSNHPCKKIESREDEASDVPKVIVTKDPMDDIFKLAVSARRHTPSSKRARRRPASREPIRNDNGVVTVSQQPIRNDNEVVVVPEGIPFGGN